VRQSVAKAFAGIDLRVREDTLGALELISRSHFDGFIIDCDGLERGTEIIVAARTSRANRRSVIFTVVNGKTSVATAMELGSNFVPGKPIDTDRLTTYFESSLHKMETEHRRYFRYQLRLDAELVRRDGRVIPAQILNVSNGGLALRLLDGAPLYGSVTVRFYIPSTQKTLITAVALLCWSREPVFGMKFFGMDADSRKAYEEWLSSMALA
jgi:PilZ domain-containing protein